MTEKGFKVRIIEFSITCEAIGESLAMFLDRLGLQKIIAKKEALKKRAPKTTLGKALHPLNYRSPKNWLPS